MRGEVGRERGNHYICKTVSCKIIKIIKKIILPCNVKYRNNPKKCFLGCITAERQRRYLNMICKEEIIKV